MVLLLTALLLTPAPQPAGEQYRAAVEAHARCDEGPLAWIVSMDARALEAAFAGQEATASWPPALVASAAVMHTRIAASLWRAGAPDRWREHLELARRFVAIIGRGPTRHSWLASWFSVAASQYLAAGEVGRAADLLDSAPSELRRDPLLMLARAAVEEFLGSGRLTPRERKLAEGLSQAERLRLSFGLYSPAFGEQQRRHLDAAIKTYEQVLASDASEFEAAVRLARIYLVLGQPHRAAAAIERAPGLDELPEPLSYYAGLVAGRVHETRGDFAHAEGSYRGALERFPTSQAAAVALAHLYVRAGEGLAARAEIEKLLARSAPGQQSDDPWAMYHAGQYWRTAALLQRMLAEVARCGG